MASMMKHLRRLTGNNNYYTTAENLMALPINQLQEVLPHQIKRKTIQNSLKKLPNSKNKTTNKKVEIIKELIRRKTNLKNGINNVRGQNANNIVRGPNGNIIWSQNIGKKISLELERQQKLLEKNNADAIERRNNPKKFYNLHTNQAARLNNLAATLSKQRSAKSKMSKKHNEIRQSAQNPMR